MKTQLVRSNGYSISQAIRLLKLGEPLVFPTDTVYGLGALIDEAAVAKLYVVKGRAFDKPIAALIARPQALAQVADLDQLSPDRRALCELLIAHFWPGGLTLVLPAQPTVPAKMISGGSTVGVRMPNHPIALTILEQCGGALAVTSANQSGHPSPNSAEAALASLDGRLEMILDGGRQPMSLESSVLDLSSEHPRLLRAGAVTAEELRAAGVLLAI